jgi:peptide/nickel transport system permease protein
MSAVEGIAAASVPRGRLFPVVAGLRSNKLFAVAVFVWIVVLLAAAFPSLFAHGDPNNQELIARLTKPGASGHALGTDELGQDIYTRIVYGARTSVFVGFGAVLVGGVIGTLLGVIGGFFRRANLAVSALIDVKMAFPGLLLALAIVVMLGHSNILILAIVLGLTGWTAYARILRGLVLTLRQREYVEAAKASGLRPARVIVAHILPNIAGTLSVLAVLDLSRAVLAEAGLSFLGLGIQAPAVSWGLMLAASEPYISTAWWLVTFPGVAIAVVVLAANIIANTLQARMDPDRRTVRRV